MGIGSHDDGNGVADSPCYQNDGVAQLNAEGNMTVSQVMNANIRQIGELSAAGQLLVERCARHVEYAVVRGQPVEPGTVGAELFGQPMRNRHIAVSAFLAVLSGAEDVLPLFSVVGLVDAQLVIIGQVFGQQRQHLALAASRPEQNIKCQKIGLVAEFFPQKLVLAFRDDKHFSGDGGTHVASGIARIETQTVECLGIIKEGGQLCVDGVEICFRIWEASGFAHLFYSLLPISNIKSGDLIHFPVSEKRNDFGVKNISLGVHGRTLYEQMQMVSDYIISRRMDVTITMLDDLLGGQAKDDNNFCGGTGAMLSFAPDGSAYPCIRYAPISIGEEKSQKVRFGSIYDGLYATDAQRQAKAELDAITRTSQSPQECLECPVSAGCGWCSGLNYELFGTANKRSTAICWAHKARVLASCYYHNRRYLEIGDCLPIEVRLPAEDGLKILPAEKWAELMHIETAALMKFADEVGIS